MKGGEPYAPIIITPSVSPVNGNEPGYTLLEINAENGLPNNLEFHFLDLEKANHEAEGITSNTSSELFSSFRLK